MADYRTPPTTDDLQALVDYCEKASQGETPDVFPVTAMERMRFEVARRRTRETCDHCGAPDPTGFQCCDDCAQAIKYRIDSPSGWSYMSDQENGDNVDCRACGRPLDDDYPIVNDADGYALHKQCAETK
jgi:hypothetical protein